MSTISPIPALQPQLDAITAHIPDAIGVRVSRRASPRSIRRASLRASPLATTRRTSPCPMLWDSR